MHGNSRFVAENRYSVLQESDNGSSSEDIGAGGRDIPHRYGTDSFLDKSYLTADGFTLIKSKRSIRDCSTSCLTKSPVKSYTKSFSDCPSTYRDRIIRNESTRCVPDRTSHEQGPKDYALINKTAGASRNISWSNDNEVIYESRQ